MGLLRKSKSAAIALSIVSGWALSGWRDNQLSAEDRFIKQPVSSAPVTPAANPSLDETPAARVTEVVALDEKAQTNAGTNSQPNNPRSQLSSLIAPPSNASAARITSPKSAKASNRAPSTSSSPAAPVPDPSPATVAPSNVPLSLIGPTQALTLTVLPQTSPPPAATIVEPKGNGQLRWLARGALPKPTQTSHHNSVGPLEISNPNFSTAASEFPLPTASAAATVSAPSQQMAIIPSAPKTTSAWTTMAVDTSTSEQEPTKKTLASLVSSQIIAERPGNENSGRMIAPIEAPPGWQAIGEELSQRIANCELLLNRKAYYSAREEAESAMLTLVRVLDLMSNRYTSEPAWFAASKAMHEAEDFCSAQRLTSDSDILRRIILSHETPVLKDADVATLAPLAAAQHYRQYAETKLIEAAQGHPWAAEVVYALGRTYQAQADVADDGADQPLRWKAVTLYRGARAIAPYNAVAANQLGYVLLQMDRAVDAREALVASLNANPSLAAYENLVEASRRLNDPGTGNWAMQQAMVLRSTIPTETNDPVVVEVDPRTFATLSPYSVGPNPQHGESAQQPYRTAAYPSTPTSNR